MEGLWAQEFGVSDDVLERAAGIRLALFDVDGVLTDGRLRIGANGEEQKVFNVLDGHGLKMLGEKIDVGIITARQSSAVDYRVKELGIRHYYSGQHDKIGAFDGLLAETGIDRQQCCFTGDDVVDLPVMLSCGLAFSVPNAHPVVQQYADWITPVPGGEGAARWVCDLLLNASGHYDEMIAGYLAAATGHSSAGGEG